jgi:uncharacterized Zn-finger protein
VNGAGTGFSVKLNGKDRGRMGAPAPERIPALTDEVVPHFHNDPGVPVIEIGAKTFMCIGALPPQDHPHVFCDMGDAIEYVCPYCSTLYRHDPALAPNEARPAECELHHLQ